MSSLSHNQFYKTKTCPWYFKGKCERKLDCRFAHNDIEKRHLPDLTKTSLCPTLLKNKVCKNIHCRYAHQASELRATDNFYKTSLCYMFMRSKCQAGMHCRHAHGVQELREASSCSTGLNANAQSMHKYHNKFRGLMTDLYFNPQAQISSQLEKKSNAYQPGKKKINTGDVKESFNSANLADAQSNALIGKKYSIQRKSKDHCAPASTLFNQDWESESSLEVPRFYKKQAIMDPFVDLSLKQNEINFMSTELLPHIEPACMANTGTFPRHKVSGKSHYSCENSYDICQAQCQSDDFMKSLSMISISETHCNPTCNIPEFDSGDLTVLGMECCSDLYSDLEFGLYGYDCGGSTYASLNDLVACREIHSTLFSKANKDDVPSLNELENSEQNDVNAEEELFESKELRDLISSDLEFEMLQCDRTKYTILPQDIDLKLLLQCCTKSQNLQDTQKNKLSGSSLLYTESHLYDESQFDLDSSTGISTATTTPVQTNIMPDSPTTLLPT